MSRREQGAGGALPGLVAGLTVLTLELVRSSGPLLDSLYSRGGPTGAAVAAVLTYAAPAPLAALLLAGTRRAARPRRSALLAGAVLLGVLRLVLQALSGEARVVAGLAAVAVAVAVLVLAVSALAGRPGRGRTAAAAVLAGAAASVGLQLVLGTWDAPWRHTLLGWTVAVGLSAVVVVLAVLVDDAAQAPHAAVRRGWVLGPVLALAAMALANPAFAASQSSLPLALAGPLLGAGLLLGAALVARPGRPPSPGAPTAAVAGTALVVGTAVALQVAGSGPGSSLLVVAALLTGQLGTALLLARAWTGRRPTGVPATATTARATGATAAAAGVAGLTTIVPLLVFQLDYDLRLGFPNALVLVATAVIAAIAGLLRGAGPVDTAGAGTAAWWPRGALLAAALLLVLGTAVAVLSSTVDRSGEDAPAATGRTVSWNLHYGVGPAGAVDLEAVARVIESHDPDVVLLQEVSRGWVQGGGADMATWLGQRLGLHVAFGAAADGRFGNVVLARAPLTDVRVRPLPFGAGPQRRSALTARTLLGSRPTTVTSLHLQHRATGGPTRVAQVEAFLSTAAEPVHLVGGDLNAVPGAPEVRLLTRAGFLSAVDAAGDPAALTAPSSRPTRRIDWVLARGVDVTEARVLTGVTLSDHLPLVVAVGP